MTFLEMERTPPTWIHDGPEALEKRGILQDRIVEELYSDDRYRRGVVRAWEKIAQADTNIPTTRIPTFISHVTGVDVATVEDDLEVLHEENEGSC